jgi:hypothetical protein
MNNSARNCEVESKSEETVFGNTGGNDVGINKGIREEGNNAELTCGGNRSEHTQGRDYE